MPTRQVVNGRERVWFGGTNGKYYYLPGTPLSRENDAEYARLLGAAAASPHGIPESTEEDTVIALFADWLSSDSSPTHRAIRCKAKTVAEQLAKRWLSTGVSEFTAAELAGYQRMLCEQKRKDGSSLYTAKTIVERLEIVRKAFSWGVVQGRVEEAHAASLERVSLSKQQKTKYGVRKAGKRSGVPLERFTATLPHLPAVIADALRIVLLTAARPDEIYRMTPADIQKSGKVILPSGAEFELGGELWAYVPVRHKTEGDRCILIPREAQAVLRPYLAGDVARPCFSPKAAYDAAHAKQAALRKPGGPGNHKRRSTRSVRRPGDTYNSVAVAKAIKRACEAHKIPRWTAYQLRHRALIEIRRKHGAEIAAAIAGHASMATTEAWYAPPSIAAAAEAVSGKA